MQMEDGWVFVFLSASEADGGRPSCHLELGDEASCREWLRGDDHGPFLLCGVGLRLGLHRPTLNLLWKKKKRSRS